MREVWERLPQLLAASTSVYGTVLKIDSTKKICKKLQGAAAGTASWATNVGNERGEVVISVLTESEDNVALKRMTSGLMERYEMAGQDPPRLLYTDRDCFCVRGPSKYQVSKEHPIDEPFSTVYLLHIYMCRFCLTGGVVWKYTWISGTS